MFKTYFDSTQITFLTLGTVFIVASILLSQLQKHKWAIVTLVAGALFIFLFAAVLDPFLNLWDERFHALVAKSMMRHPFKPTLYPEMAISGPYNAWDGAYIWLHKQPLFMWQMALSMKIFGINEFAVRLPSVIMSTLMVLFVYRCGRLLLNEKLGYYSAFICATSAFIIKLVSGQEGMDHNDLAFTFYISASIWAYIEYYYSKKNSWIILVGVFAGGAVLNKWLVGLLVYAAWGINLLADGEKFSFKKFRSLILSLLIAYLIFLPWQIYILTRFHDLAIQEYKFNSDHIFKVMEGHGGNIWYHFDKLTVLYGFIAPVFLLVGFVLLARRVLERKIIPGLIAMPVLIYLLFTIAKTKVESHPFCICLMMFLTLGICIAEFSSMLEKWKPRISKVMIIALLVSLAFFSIDIEKLQAEHTLWKKDNVYSRALMQNKAVYLKLNKELPKGTVVFNVHGIHYIDMMFYTDFVAYNFVPKEEQYRELKDKKREIAIFTQYIKLPDYLKNDSSIILIDDEMGGYN